MPPSGRRSRLWGWWRGCSPGGADRRLSRAVSPRARAGRHGGDQAFWYCCPWGCGVVGPLHVGKGFKPTMAPSWTWMARWRSRPSGRPSIM
nr:DUF6527 family protein [Kaustia mangrovi]